MNCHADLNYVSKNVNSVSLVNIFGTFFRIGLFTLGGGLAMSPVIRHELVIKRRWIEDVDFFSVISLATVVPGAIAVNIAYLLGRNLPSFFVILFIAVFLLPFFNYPKVTAFLRGCAIAVAGQLAFAGFIFGRKLLRQWQHFLVCALVVMTVGVFRLHPIWGLTIAIVFGFWLCPDKI